MSWSTIKSRHPEWLANHSVNIIVQAALKKEPEIAAVPLASDLVGNPQQLQIVKLLLTGQAMARPFAAPPGLPEDRKSGAARGVRRHHEGCGFSRRGAKLDFDVRPVRGERSTRCSRRSMTRRRTCSARRPGRFRASKPRRERIDRSARPAP
jgi:hypothetical protein